MMSGQPRSIAGSGSGWRTLPARALIPHRASGDQHATARSPTGRFAATSARGVGQREAEAGESRPGAADTFPNSCEEKRSIAPAAADIRLSGSLRRGGGRLLLLIPGAEVALTWPLSRSACSSVASTAARRAARALGRRCTRAPSGAGWRMRALRRRMRAFRRRRVWWV